MRDRCELNIYDDIQYESWSKRMGDASCRLPISAIVEICDEHCLPIVKRHIRNCSRVIHDWEDLVRSAKTKDYDLEGWWELAFLGARKPVVELERRKALRSVLSGATVKLAQKGGNYEEDKDKITQEDVERARTVDIQGLYGWEKGKSIGRRFIACCPFHPEKTPSFTIFADNKFRCFGGCAVYGDAIDFYMAINNVEFIDAVKQLIRR